MLLLSLEEIYLGIHRLVSSFLPLSYNRIPLGIKQLYFTSFSLCSCFRKLLQAISLCCTDQMVQHFSDTFSNVNPPKGVISLS